MHVRKHILSQIDHGAKEEIQVSNAAKCFDRQTQNEGLGVILKWYAFLHLVSRALHGLLKSLKIICSMVEVFAYVLRDGCSDFNLKVITTNFNH